MIFIKKCFLATLCFLWFVSCDSTRLDVLFSKEKEKASGITVATWNIGHFSNGAKPYSVIKADSYDEKLASFKKILEDMDADLLFLNEYSEIFGVDKDNKKQKTKKVLFNNYRTKVFGNQVGFSCNAIFGDLVVTNIKCHEFRNTVAYVKELPRVANYYYISGNLFYKRNNIKIVCAHTISKNRELCQMMIAEIIDSYKDYDKVIICGDWNTGDYKKFVNAGFTSANDGSFKTYPQKNYPLDNIFVKGLKISNVRLVETDLSDHCPLVCEISFE